MSKFKIIEEGRLSANEMKALTGGVADVVCSGYSTICDWEVKQQIPCPGYYNGGSGTSTGNNGSHETGNGGCYVFGAPPRGGGGGNGNGIMCGNRLGITPNHPDR